MADAPLPGYKPAQALWLIVVFFAVLFGGATLLDRYIGSVLAGALGFIGAVAAVSLLSRRFIPVVAPRDKVPTLARKFRERATQIEESMRWGREPVPDPSWPDRELLKEVHETVRRAGLPFLRGFDFNVPDERYAQQAGRDEELRSALEARVHQLRSRADLLDDFAKKQN